MHVFHDFRLAVRDSTRDSLHDAVFKSLKVRSRCRSIAVRFWHVISDPSIAIRGIARHQRERRYYG